MKTKIFIFTALALGMLASCSDTNEPRQDHSNPLANGDGYVGVSISMPTIASAGTRVNDDFNDGDPEEYQVDDNNSYLILFQKSASEPNEDAATFCGIYKLTTDFSALHGSTQITTESNKATQIIPNLITKDNLYAYVILNAAGIVTDYDATTHSSFTFGEGNTVTKGDGSTETLSKLSVTTSTTFAQFRYVELATIHNAAKDAFVMTNTVLSDKQGGSANPTGAQISTLAELDAQKIYPTAALAEANPAGHVDVERAAAKVTVTATLGSKTTDGVDIDAGSFLWAVGNVNQTYYNTRKWINPSNNWLSLTTDGTQGTAPTNSKYRFVSNAPLGTTVLSTDQDVYRTYWGIDPNYDVENNATTTARVLLNATVTPSLASAVTTYVPENTFDTEHQSFRNTTYISCSMTFNSATDFYIIPSYGDNKILQAPTVSGNTSIKYYLLATYMSTDDDLKAYLTAAPTNIDNITLTLTPDATGTATVSELSSTDPAASAIDFAAIKTEINKLTIYYYAGGRAYYAARIKHFGAGGVAAADGAENGCETPWNRFLHTENTVASAYGSPANEANYLGRYGIVRNNWYDITVNGARKIGKPVPLTPDGTPDDEVENYLSVEIHILPWAKRTQTVTL